MSTTSLKAALIALPLLLPCVLLAAAGTGNGPAASRGQAGAAVPFDSNGWIMKDAVLADHLGRPSLMGIAYLKGASFENGVVEVDVAASGARSYPGIIFRMQDEGNFERVYIRPHVAGVFDNAIQYAPSFNGIEGWQLYNGPGFTAGVQLPRDVWVHLKLEVKGTRARLFVNDMERPALVMNNLARGISKGAIGLMGPKDQSAYFSSFTYRPDDTLDFGPAPDLDEPPGVVRDWQISGPFKLSAVDMELPLSAQKLGAITWRRVASEPSGLVDVSRFIVKPPGEPSVIFAKAEIPAERDMVQKLEFGYSDAVTLFLNGKNLFSGDNSYRRRDASFQGIVGPFDAVYLPLEKGSNELVLALAESFGGWGFMARRGDAVYAAPGVTKLWETDRAFAVPETAVFDPVRGALYVSNYDGYTVGTGIGKQFISKVSLDGAIEDVAWSGGVTNPTGMAIAGDKLFVVMRLAVGEIDIPSRTLVKRHFITGAAFPNDVAVDADGTMYVTDSFKSCIFRLAGGACEEWLSGPAIERPNGILLAGGKLIVGVNGDSSLKSIDLETKEIRTIACWSSGTIDGISACPDGSLLVSHNEGRLYRVSPSGGVTKLLDTSVAGDEIADFAFVPDKNLVVIPTFGEGTVSAYTVR